MIFPYDCPECGRVEQTCRSADRDRQSCARCGNRMTRDTRAQYAASHVQIRSNTQSNVPDDIKWRSASDPVRQEYARNTYGGPDQWGTSFAEHDTEVTDPHSLPGLFDKELDPA